MAMVNHSQMQSILKQLVEDLGREPTSRELLWAIEGWLNKKEKDNSTQNS